MTNSKTSSGTVTPPSVGDMRENIQSNRSNSSYLDPFEGIPTPPMLSPSKTSKRRDKIRTAWRRVSGTLKSLKGAQQSKPSIQDLFTTPQQSGKRKSSSTLPSSVVVNEKKTRISDESSDLSRHEVTKISKLNLVLRSAESEQSMTAQLADEDAHSVTENDEEEGTLSSITSPTKHRPITDVEPSLYSEPTVVPDAEYDPLPESLHGVSEADDEFSCDTEKASSSRRHTQEEIGSVTRLPDDEGVEVTDHELPLCCQRTQQVCLNAATLFLNSMSQWTSQSRRIDLLEEKMEQEIRQLRSDFNLMVRRKGASKNMRVRQHSHRQKQQWIGDVDNEELDW